MSWLSIERHRRLCLSCRFAGLAAFLPDQPVEQRHAPVMGGGHDRGHRGHVDHALLSLDHHLVLIERLRRQRHQEVAMRLVTIAALRPTGEEFSIIGVTA